MGQPRGGAGGARGSRPALGLSFFPGAAASPAGSPCSREEQAQACAPATGPWPRGPLTREPGARTETPGLDALAESSCNGVRKMGTQKRRLHLFILKTAAVTPFLHAEGVFQQSRQTRGRSETERTCVQRCPWKATCAHLLAPTGRSSAGTDSPPSEGSAVAVLRVDIAAVGSRDARLTLNR